MFTGRPTPPPGEPLFTDEDTAGALALAEEERDTCPQCGYPKAWCRDPDHQFSFEVDEVMCFATWRLAQFQESAAWDKKHAATKRATLLSARFREGHEPDLEAGLELEGHQHENPNEQSDRGERP